MGLTNAEHEAQHEKILSLENVIIDLIKRVERLEWKDE